jgi:serine/threonine-protein kinase
MGVVVEAEHRVLGKRVAVKVLQSHGGEPSAREEDRLRVEAETLGRMKSPHVVDVTDLGRSPAGHLYVVMELLRGRSLADEVRVRGRLPPAEAVALALQMLEGLAAAHAIGVVHRDLKPANVFLCDPAGAISAKDPARGRTARVLDFGVAKVLGSEAGPRPPEVPTAEGMVLGTPRFLTPEHLGVAPVDERTDIYGMGLLLYVMLTGRGPFDGEQGMAGFARAAAYDPPPPPSGFAAMPRSLEFVILRCLEKDKEARYSSVPALIQALTAVATALAPEPPPQQGSDLISRQQSAPALPVYAPAPPPVRTEDATAPQSVRIAPVPQGSDRETSRLARRRSIAFWSAMVITMICGIAIFIVVAYLLGVVPGWGRV